MCSFKASLKNIFLILCVAALTKASFAQVGEYRFESISVVDGLPENTIKSIYQDNLGLLWLGTRNGLVKYDGYSFQTYIPKPEDKRSGNIVSMAEDHNGNIWIGTSGGLFQFERRIEEFKHYDLSGIDTTNNNDVNIYNLIVDDDNLVWIAMGSGLVRFNADNGNSQLFKTQNSAPVTFVFEDSKKNLLVGTSQGLLQFDREKSELVEQKVIRSNEYGNRYWITKIYEDRQQNLWFSFFGRGILCYKLKENKLINFTADDEADIKISSNLVADILEDDDGKIWVGTQNNGINIINLNSLQIRSLQSSPVSKSGIASNNIQCLYQDRSGVVWIGTLTAGLNKINRSVRMFNRYNPNFEELENNDFAVSAVISDMENNVWIGFSNNGLAKYERAQQGNLLRKINVGNNFADNNISSIEEDRVGNIWVGTNGRGLKRINKRNGRVDSFFLDEIDRASGSSPSVRSIEKDLDGNLYLATNFAGIIKIASEDLASRNPDYEIVDDPYQLLTQSTILFIYADRKGFIWFGTDGNGLVRYDPSTGFVDNYFDPELGFDIVLSIFEDSNDRLWCGTYYGGLFLFDPDSGNKTPYLVENGIAKCAFFSIMEDDNKNLWLGTDRGLAKFTYESESFKIYNRIDGVQGDQFMLNSVSKDSSGIIYFGGQSGINGFMPVDINGSGACEEIVFTELKVFNDIVQPGDDSPLKANINVAEKITLEYWQNDIQIEFAAMDFSQSKLNQYSYYLENYDPEWRNIGTNRSANLTNLSPGNYILKVKASSKDGIWADKSVSIEIKVDTPPWLTWWAYVIYIVVFIGIVYSIIRYDITRTRLKYNLRLQEAETEKLHEIGQLKSRFFANISHEFRTPLTLILSPIQKLLQKSTDEESKKYFKIIQRNSTQLLNLVNQLLDLSKLDAGKMSLSLKHENVIKYITPLVHSFTSLADNQHKNFEISLSETKETGYFDPEKIERVIINLLSNAFKFTNEGDCIKVSAYTAKSELVLQIEDSGIGIPEEKIQSIFDRFIQIEEHQSSSTQGSGLGLALVKELVELHSGQIKVTSKLGEGTSFNIIIPLDLESFSNYEISEGPVLIEKDNLQYDSGEMIPGVADESIIQDRNDKKLILVVEDNFELRGFINDSLSDLYNIVEAENGKIGFDKARDEVPDLIVSDLMMPEMDGIEMCNMVKDDERTNHIPLILLTAKESDSSKLEGFEKGADDYITKPFNIELLRARIANLIQQRERLRERYGQNFTPASLNLKVTSADDKFMKKVYDIINQNLTNEDFNVELFGQELYMSRVQLYRKIKALTGKSVSELIRIYRLERAAELIKQNFGSISDVCYEVGFKEQTNFSTSFKKHFGKSPSEFKFETRKN